MRSLSAFCKQISAIENITQLGAYADAICADIAKNRVQAKGIREVRAYSKAEYSVWLLSFELEVAKLDNQVEILTKRNLDKNQRDYYLNEKIKAIKQELAILRIKRLRSSSSAWKISCFLNCA